MEKTKKRKGKQLFLFGVLFTVLFFIISDLMSVSDCTSLANIKGFYMEPKNSIDVAMIGPSEFYADYSATQAWKQYGYTSYSLAVAGVPGNLYKSMLNEVLKRQNPKLVVFEVNGFLQDDTYFEREGQLHTWIDNMPWSKNKIDTIREVIPEKERYAYYCNLAAAHNNWKAPSQLLGCAAVKAGMDLNGYSYTKGFGTTTKTSNKVKNCKPKKLSYTTLSQSYLNDLLTYCKDNGVKHVLFVRFPHGRTFENPQVMDQIAQTIESYGYDFLNLNDNYADTGIDPEHDFYNVEHLNVSGMQKLTSYFGGYLTAHYDIQGTHDEKLTAYWNSCADKTASLLAECESDLAAGIARRYYELSVYLKPVAGL